MSASFESREPDAREYVYDFTEGRAAMADLLGGKGANLAEMTWLGLPVPPGYTITTAACRVYLRTGRMPAGLAEQIDAHLGWVEQRTRRGLADPDAPLLLSVRSGAKYSMPGMMETILNIGVCDTTVDGLAKLYGDERFAWDCYRRLVQMYGRIVYGVPGDVYDHALAEAKQQAGYESTASDSVLGAGGLRVLTHRFQQLTKEHSGHEVPQNPHEQLLGAVRAVFDSWTGERARVYRERERIPQDLGTAVNIMAMVFGNLGPDSGTGVASTRDPATGARGIHGDYLTEAEGTDVVSGVRDTLTLDRFGELDSNAHARLLRIAGQLETHFRDMCDLEFTVERGKLWMLQTWIGERTSAAAFRIAADLVAEGLIDEDEALRRVSAETPTGRTAKNTRPKLTANHLSGV